MIISHAALYKEGAFKKYRSWIDNALPEGYKAEHRTIAFKGEPAIPGLMITFIDNVTFRNQGIWDVCHTFVTKGALLAALGMNTEELKMEFDMKPIETTPEVTETREV